MDSDADGTEMEVVEEDRHVVVKALAGGEVQLEGSLADTVQFLLLLRPGKQQQNIQISTM